MGPRPRNEASDRLSLHRKAIPLWESSPSKGIEGRPTSASQRFSTQASKPTSTGAAQLHVKGGDPASLAAPWLLLRFPSAPSSPASFRRRLPILLPPSTGHSKVPYSRSKRFVWHCTKEKTLGVISRPRMTELSQYSSCKLKDCNPDSDHTTNRRKSRKQLCN